MSIDIRDALFDEIYEIASKDKDVIFISADTDAFTLRKFKADFPEQYMDIGIAEQNMIAVASGLALCGKKVFIYSIIPFITLRCYEHIKVNICSMNLPITIIGLGSGFSFAYDGPTHHAVCDVAVMRTLPEMTILNPAEQVSAKASAQITYELGSPTYIRLDKGRWPRIYDEGMRPASLSVVKSGERICIISTGTMTHRAIEVAKELKQKFGIDVAVMDVFQLKPFEISSSFLEVLLNFNVVTLEENVLTGGLGSLISEILTDHQWNIPLLRIALPDEQCFQYGDRTWLHKKCGIDKGSVLNKILEWL